MRAGGGRRAGPRDPRSHRQGIACVPEPPPERRRDRAARQPTPRRAVSGGLSDLAVPADERLDRGVAGAPEPISGPRASNRRGGGAAVERRRSRRRGRNGRRVEGERPFEGAGERDGPLDLQRDGVDRSQAPRGGPLQQRTDPVRESVPCRPRDPAAPLRRPRPVPPRRAGRTERGEPRGPRGTREPPRTEHARPVPLPGPAAVRHAARPHVRVPERPGSVHPEFLLPRGGTRGGQTPRALGRRHGLRPHPARSDAPRPVATDRSRAQGVPESPLTQPASCLSYLPAWISFEHSFAGFPSTVTPFETQVPTTSRTRAFRVFACIASAFMLAILIACASDRFPTRVLPASPEPFSIFSSFAMSADVGGVPTSIVKAFDFGSTISVTGTFIPSKLFVLSLIALMISTMFRPRGPSAGPKGGPGVALPPSTRTFSFSTIVRNLGEAAPESEPT